MRQQIGSYVAIGDSLSEGLGDFNFANSRIHSGWTDKFAALLARQAHDHGLDFRYSNLAIRGSKIGDILGEQLDAALLLKPDLITIMAGQNDLISNANNLPVLETQLREGISRAKAAGCLVVVANTINPIHIKVFKVLAVLAARMTQMIEKVVEELEVPLLDIHRIEELADIAYWAEDMVHFSNHGHVKVGNTAADVLKLDYRISELDAGEIVAPDRGVVAVTRWVLIHVVPFFWRRIRRVSSGAGISPKLPQLEVFTPRAYEFEMASKAA